MNYFSHAWHSLHQPNVDAYHIAGMAVPDWLSVASRRTKCRSKHVEPYLENEYKQLAQLAAGIKQHHTDDMWFHESEPFNRLSLEFAKRIKEEFGESTSMRPWFLGHILVELLLDDELIQRDPSKLVRYYDLIAEVEAEWVADQVAMMCGRDVGKLAKFIRKFLEIRFLEDYHDDETLTMRLNQVMNRVGLDELPESFPVLLPKMREDISLSATNLVTPPSS